MSLDKKKFSKHVLERMKSRNISKEQVILVLDNPDRIIKESCMEIYQKKITINGSLYLHRVFINVCKEPNLIITTYRTSKFEKYEY